MSGKRQANTLDSFVTKKAKTAWGIDARFPVETLKPMLEKFKDLREDYGLQFFETYMEIRFHDKVGVGLVVLRIEKDPGMTSYYWTRNLTIFVRSETMYNAFKLAQKGQLVRLRCKGDDGELEIKFTGVSADPEDKINQACTLVIDQVDPDNTGHDESVAEPAIGMCSVVVRTRNLFTNLKCFSTLKLETVRLTVGGPVFVMTVEKDNGNDISLVLKMELDESAHQENHPTPLESLFSIKLLLLFGDYGALFEYIELTIFDAGPLRYYFNAPWGSLTAYVSPKTPD